MSQFLLALYERLVLRHPVIVLVLLAVLTAGAVSQLGKLRIDASADSLLLQGDPSLEFFREVSKRYSSEDFLLLTWQPDAPLFADASLDPLKRMADELRELPGVSSVVTVWDVPLLETRPLSLSAVTSGDPLPSLRDPTIDREAALAEFTSSPIYADLLVGRDGEVTAVQVNLERDERYFELLREREALREKKDARTAAEAARLAEVEAAFKAHSAVLLEQQSELVASVRSIADRYREHARIFVGGVPMIAADMVDFVRSDLVVFGSAIIVVMLFVLAIVFRRVRWTLIPLLTCSVTVTFMLGLLAAIDWRMTVISSNFVAVLLIVTLAIAIHLVVRYRELHALQPEGDPRQRVRDTVRLMFVPCAYTALTTMVAFVSLVVSDIQPVIDFGWMMTLGIAVAFLVCFTLLPSLVLLWPKGRPVRHTGADAPLTLHFARFADRHGRSVLWTSAALILVVVAGVSQLRVENRFIDYFKESTEIYRGMELLDSRLGGTIPLDIVLSAPDSTAPLPGLEPGGDGGGEPVAADDPFAADAPGFDSAPQAREPAGNLAEDDPFAQDDPFAAEDPFAGDGDPFAGGGETFEPSYWFSLEGMRTIDAAHELVASREETGKVLSLATTFSVVRDLLGEDIGSVELALVQRSLPEDVARQLVDPYFDAELEEARITVRVKETSKTLRRDQLLRELSADLAELDALSADEVRLTGMLVLYNNVLQSLFRSQILTLGAVFLAILLMFWVLFRSFSLAMVALAPNLLAATLVLGIMGLVGIPLDIMTITIAAIVVGIGVDDCVHYVYRFREEFRQDRDYLAAMYRSHGSIGRAMYYTTITIVIGFSMLTLSNFTPSIYFGLLTVLAMTAAVLGALLLLPRLIILFRPLGPEGQ
ncbi:MAG TPA: hypothetical protein DD491_05995 [Halieaceae bacterium]|nr:hypothetical protein [Halieaceae bacterium]